MVCQMNSPHTKRTSKSLNMRWVGPVARMEEYEIQTKFSWRNQTERDKFNTVSKSASEKSASEVTENSMHYDLAKDYMHFAICKTQKDS